jgi:hypothetical protein
LEVLAAHPFAARGVAWQEQPGQHTLTVVCKVTYSLRPGTSPVAREREDINEHDNHWDDDKQRSLYAPTDLAPIRNEPEVLLVGSAYAPRGEPVRSLVVRLAVGDVDKSFEVHGQRTLDREGQLVEGALWTQMPLRYERAAGGAGSWNPVGIDPDAADAFGRRSLPNLQPLGAEWASGAIAPVGFGPISPTWPIRRDRLGGRETTFSGERWAETPLGEDFDASFFRVAPEDQRLDVLRPDEPILLEHLHPDHPRFVTKLAGVRPRVKVAPLGMPPWELTMTADLLWIDTNRSLCTLTWRGQVPLDDPEQPGSVLVGAEENGKTVRWPAPAARPSTPGAPPASRGRSPSVQPSAMRPASASPPAAADPSTLDEGEDQDLRAHTVVDDGSLAPGGSGDVLPFRERSRTMVLEEMMREASRGRPGEPRRAATRARAQQAARDEETGMIEAPPQRGSMPAWLSGRSETIPSPPPSSGASARPPVAPPPPVGTLLRPANATPFQSAAAASDAALHEPTSPPPLTASAPAAPPSFGSLAARRAAPPPERPVLPPGDDEALASATYLGVFQASNAAAVAAPVDDDAPKRADAKHLPAPSPAPRALVDLIWLAPAILPIVRATPALAPLLPAQGAPPPADDASAIELAAKADRAAIASVLARATPVVDVEGALAASAGEDGALRPTAIVVAGELELPFDEVERLRVVAAVAGPLAGSDKRLKDTLDLAKDLLAAPLAVSHDTAASMTERVREAWAKANRLLRPDHLDATSRRALLEQRSYQLRELFDASWIRALLVPAPGRAALPAYLPASLAKTLPLFARFPARVLAEVVPQQDELEAQPVALRVGALARSIAARGRR